MSCQEELKDKGYNLNGFSPDFYECLEECPYDCEVCYSICEATYG